MIAFTSCNKPQNEKAKNIFQNHLSKIESLVKLENEEYNLDLLDPSILFLETITRIQSASTENYDPTKLPTIQNWNLWRDWYEINQDMLAWNTKTNEVYLIE
jgi:hypothetical protein